jgi:flagellar hook assembly protein FlgD
VKLEVFDAQGRAVATLWEGTRAPGEHQIEWDGKDASGRDVASGVYFCRLRAGKQNVAVKMVLLK